MRLTGDWKLQKKDLTIFVRNVRGYRRISIDGFILRVSNIVIEERLKGCSRHS